MEREREKKASMDAIAEHLEQVRRRVARLVRGRADLIDDYVQETMLEACRSVAKHGPPRNPKAWLGGIADHVVYGGLEVFRRRQGIIGNPEHPQGGTTGTVLDQVAKADEEALLRGIVESLPDSNHAAIDKYYWQNMSCQEIGRQMGMTEQAVKLRLHRSRADMRRRLAPEAKLPAR